MADDYSFTTLVLRFRDLVTVDNDTIRLHKEIIDDADGVWWGWWSKGTEQIPDQAFRRVAEKAAGVDGLEILLLDSGNLRLYRATCRGLEWRADHHLLPSPNSAETPPYYRTTPYLAWFRLTSIEPEEIGQLSGFSCVRMDNFFRTGTSRYLPFYDKRIYSAEELKQQERTIWFVRPVADADPTHEIALLDSRRVSPAHFTTEALQHESRTILWISDPHLSNNHHGFPMASTPTTKSLGHAIEKACREVALLENVAGVWISGDLTWTAAAGEFGLARKFINRIQSWANLDSYSYAVCPGNHDVRFSASPADKDQPVAAAAADANAAYASFYKDLFYLQPNEYLCCGRRYLLGGAVPVEVVLLNSSLLQQAQGQFQGHGFVGEAQLNHVSEQFRWGDNSPNRPIRVLVVHHHLLPVTFQETPVNGRTYSVALDAEAITRWAVRSRVDMVLHGHMHQPFFSRLTRRITPSDAGPEHTLAIVGGGSAGVEQAHLGEVARNTFATLTFHTHKIEVTMYSVHNVNPSERLWSAEFQLIR